MKTITLKIATIALLLSMFACSTDKKEQLLKLKDQQTALSEKIKQIESELKAEKPDSLNPEEFKFVGITDVTASEFDHFIRVQRL